MLTMEDDGKREQAVPPSPPDGSRAGRHLVACQVGEDAGERPGRHSGRRADRQPDPDTSAQIIGYREEFHREGRTVVMVTHAPREAERARRKLRLAGGKIVRGEASARSLHVARPGEGCTAAGWRDFETCAEEKGIDRIRFLL